MKNILWILGICIPLLSLGQKTTPLSLRLLPASIVGMPSPTDDIALTINRIYKEGYYKWGKDSLLNLFLPAAWQELDSLLALTNDNNTKKRIRYYYSNALLNLSESIAYKIQRGETWKIIADIVSGITPLPKESELTIYPEANEYLHHYMGNALREVMLQIKEQKEEMEVAVPEKFGRPMDSIINLANQYGETFLMVVYAEKVLPTYAYERYLANRLLEETGEGDLARATAIRSILAGDFPSSGFLPVCDMEVAALQHRIAGNLHKSDIIFLSDTANINSLQSLIAPYKGKVVYLDIWGTWCGPCMHEITQYTGALKAHFKNEPGIVFLYLATEREIHHERWKQFILYHEIKGYHLTKTDQGTEPFWIDLLHTENVPRLYPTYAIFDRNGDLVAAPAPRPSDGEKLYRQLEEVLGR